MTDLAANGSCENPVQIGKAQTPVVSTNKIIMSDTVSSPIYMSSRGSQNASWTTSIPGGNFGGM